MTIVEQVILSGGILVIAALTIGNVFCRTFLGFSLAFAEEVSQFLIVLVTFVGLSYGAAQGRHIRMTAIYDELPQGLKRGLTIFICFFTCGMLAYLTWFAVSYAQTVNTLGTVSPVLQVPLSWVYLSAPLGLGLAAVQYFLAGIKNIVSDEIYLAYNVPAAYDTPPEDGI
jgi:TRAP-type C4-dicarboxylate transport system permease small subunit